jgi:putative ATPase
MDNTNSPLAVRMRPKRLEDFIGQEHILGEGKLLRRAIESKKVPSLIFYGPPGTGKTTLGLIITENIAADFVYLNAAFTSTAEVKKVLQEAKKTSVKQDRRTLLFIDEIHRFNKLQQEALVPDTETGAIIFIGATIYNPHYYLIRSLISRSIVAQFKPLPDAAMVGLLKRALEDPGGLKSKNASVDEEALRHIANQAAGDARKALNSLEIAVLSTPADTAGKIHVGLAVAKESIQKNIFYDKKDDYHYDTISAFIKSVRGSDPDSALYWLAKMLVSGEDPRFIARRLIILASEDIGNAEPFGLVMANSCFQAVESVGMPEANLILAQTTIYLACSPKSNSATLAVGMAISDVENETTREVPDHIKTCLPAGRPTSPDYKYPHSYGGYVDQDYGAVRQYYFPLAVAEEKRLKDFLEQIKQSKK